MYRDSKQFFTSIKEHADFIQYAISSTGGLATISVYDRVGTKHSNSKYTYKTIEYRVTAIKWKNTTLSSNKTSREDKIKEIKVENEKCYCFMMDGSHDGDMWMARRNGYIFATGNSHLMFELIANVSKYKEIAFFSFEMGERRTDDRMYKKIQNEKALENWKIDFYSRNIDDLVNEIKLFSRDGIKFFVIDSMMKIETSASKNLIEHQRIISHELSKVAQERDIIVCLINQMNKSDIKEGRLDIKGAGDQEYDSDILLFYRRDEKGNRQLVCKKNRQDEVLFMLDLKLDNDGNTVAFDEFVPYYENIREEVVTMPTLQN